MLLNKEQILAANDLKHETVEIPEWGGSVRIQEMTAAAWDKWEREVYDERGSVKENLPDSGLRAALVSKCLVDDDGMPIFTADEIATKNSKIINKLFIVARRVNFAAKIEQDELIKNSDAAPENASSGE